MGYVWPNRKIFRKKFFWGAPPTPKNRFWAFRQAVQNEKNGEVDHDNHVDISLVVNLADVADRQEDDGGDEDGEDVAD